MQFVDEYRNRELIYGIAAAIKKTATGTYKFMEVCGGHTAAIHRFGIPSLIPANIELISGPGCPVCVTGKGFIDTIIEYLHIEDCIIATFGDLIRLPGSSSSLEEERAAGADVRMVFSGLQAIEIAKANKNRKIIFPGIGFETTAPGTAITISRAFSEGISNLKVLSAHKIMPPAMDLLLKEGSPVNGFICPGHVSAISGADAFEFIPGKYRTAAVITGFEPADILQAIYMLVRQVNEGNPSVEIQYKRAVSAKGNISAKMQMNEVFEVSDSYWRGLGVITGSGLKIRKKYSTIEGYYNITEEDREAEQIEGACLCGEILRGKKTPAECSMFGINCSPDNPSGACMVSQEGVCNTWFRYRRNG
jgi:hydrogenase expression/formation protein HypD